MKLSPILFLIILFSSCGHLNELQNLKIENTRTPVPVLNPIWSQKLDPQFDSGNLPIALQAPLIYEGILFTGDNRGFFRAYDLDKKIEMWSTEDKTTYHSKPLGYKDQIIYGTVSGRLFSRQIENGALKYEVDLGASIDSSFYQLNGRLFVQLRNHQVMCIDIESGKTLWGFKKSVSSLTTLQRTSTPIVYKNKVIAGFADGTIGALSLEEGVLLYEVKINTGSKFLDIDSDLVVEDNKLIVSSVTNGVTVINPENGSIIKKTDWISLTKAFKLNDTYLFGLNSGELLISDKDFNEIKRIQLSKAGLTNIVNFKNQLVISSLKGELISIDSKTFTSTGKFEFGHSYSSLVNSIDSNEGFLAVLSSRNRLFLFQ